METACSRDDWPQAWAALDIVLLVWKDLSNAFLKDYGSLGVRN